MFQELIVFMALVASSLPQQQGPLVATDDPKSCTLQLGWGHTWDAKAKRRLKKESWLVQGCNIGQASSGELAGRGRYQKGPNGDWFADSSSVESDLDSNGGLMLFNLREAIKPLKNRKHEAKLLSKYFLQGFVRLTQWNYLDLVSHAIEKAGAPGSGCASVKVKFRCLAFEDNDQHMGQSQLERRLRVATTPLDIPELKGNAAYEALNRFEALGDCFENVKGSPKAYPEACGQELVVTAKSKISQRCLGWLLKIEGEYPQWGPDRKRRALPAVSAYPSQGPIF